MQSNATDFIEKLTVEELESELEALRRYADEKQRARDRAVEEYGKASNKVQTCQQLLSLKQSSQKRVSNRGETPGDGMDQTSTVLALIRESGPIGLRPKEIGKALEGRGVAVKPAYLHTILMRLKKRSDVRSQRSVYFAVK
jgi:hypothetical protein